MNFAFMAIFDYLDKEVLLQNLELQVSCYN